MSTEPTGAHAEAQSPVANLVRDATHRLGLESTVIVETDDTKWTVTVSGKQNSADIKIVATGASAQAACESANAKVKEVAGW